MDPKALVAQMTLEEKAGLCSGLDFWHTKPVERLGVPPVMLTDGPHGLRKQEGDAGALDTSSVQSVCFPAACATACSFDRALIEDMGVTLGAECQAEDISVLLGPAVNIKRSPLCGRNFEYISEDPYLTGELAAAYIKGVQSQHIGVSIKHFAANNQETNRMAVSSELDERTLREIYLPGFETAVKKAKPWTVMCSYNKINGVYASESRRLLTDILRDEWGFDGYVVSDWGAVGDRVAAIRAGLDLEMPSTGGETDRELVNVVRSGALSESVLDEAAERILRIVFEYMDHKRGGTFDRAADHRKAVDIAKQCVVLLKNDNVLPLKEQETGVAFIGGFAKKPRYQGGGSSHIHPFNVTPALEAASKYGAIDYAEGFSSDNDAMDEALFNEAVGLAKRSSAVVVFAGLPDAYESEGFDRSHMRLPECQNALIAEILKVNKNVIVVLQNGSPVEMPWAGDVRAIVEAYLGGEGIGEAIADILYGKANPCGKLAETFPLRLQDNPSYINFPGAGSAVHYDEGIFVGYRWYDAREMGVLFPFGHGLSYTTFELSNITISNKDITAGEHVTVSADVTNTGAMAGKEVVQLYVMDSTGAAVRPQKELKGFAAVMLEPGERKTVTMELDKRSFAWYNADIGGWYAATGDYTVMVGTSSRDIAWSEVMRVTSDIELPFTVSGNTTLGEFFRRPRMAEYVRRMMAAGPAMPLTEDEGFKVMMEKMMMFMPLRSIRMLGNMPSEVFNKIIDDLNALK